MKARSEEYLAEARRFLRAAEVLLDADLPENSAAESYSAMLQAAAAALSEEDREAKTHRGTWRLFDELFVQTERFDRELRDVARRAQQLREDSDYRLGGANQEEGRAVLAAARRFVTAVETMFE